MSEGNGLKQPSPVGIGLNWIWIWDSLTKCLLVSQMEKCIFTVLCLWTHVAMVTAICR